MVSIVKGEPVHTDGVEHLGPAEVPLGGKSLVADPNGIGRALGADETFLAIQREQPADEVVVLMQVPGAVGGNPFNLVAPRAGKPVCALHCKSATGLIARYENNLGSRPMRQITPQVDAHKALEANRLRVVIVEGMAEPFGGGIVEGVPPVGGEARGTCSDVPGNRVRTSNHEAAIGAREENAGGLEGVLDNGAA